MTSDPEQEGRTHRRFLEPPEDPDADTYLDDLTIDDFDVCSRSEPTLIPQIEGYLDIKTQFSRFLDEGYSPEEAVGALGLIYTGLPVIDLDGFRYHNITREELTRLYLYRELSDLPDYKVADLSADSTIYEFCSDTEI